MIGPAFGRVARLYVGEGFTPSHEALEGRHCCSCFDRPALRMPTVSFDRVRTNGWPLEGLSTNGN